MAQVGALRAANLRNDSLGNLRNTFSTGSEEGTPTTEGTPDRGEGGNGDGNSDGDLGREGDGAGTRAGTRTGAGARAGAGMRAVQRVMVAAVTTRGRRVRKKKIPIAAPAATTGYSLVAVGGRDLCPSVNTSSVPKGERWRSTPWGVHEILWEGDSLKPTPGTAPPASRRSAWAIVGGAWLVDGSVGSRGAVARADRGVALLRSALGMVLVVWQRNTIYFHPSIPLPPSQP